MTLIVLSKAQLNIWLQSNGQHTSTFPLCNHFFLVMPADCAAPLFHESPALVRTQALSLKPSKYFCSGCRQGTHFSLFVGNRAKITTVVKTFRSKRNGPPFERLFRVFIQSRPTSPKKIVSENTSHCIEHNQFNHIFSRPPRSCSALSNV